MRISTGVILNDEDLKEGKPPQGQLKLSHFNIHPQLVKKADFVLYVRRSGEPVYFTNRFFKT